MDDIEKIVLDYKLALKDPKSDGFKNAVTEILIDLDEKAQLLYSAAVNKNKQEIAAKHWDPQLGSDPRYVKKFYPKGIEIDDCIFNGLNLVLHSKGRKFSMRSSMETTRNYRGGWRVVDKEKYRISGDYYATSGRVKKDSVDKRIFSGYFKGDFHPKSTLRYVINGQMHIGHPNERETWVENSFMFLEDAKKLKAFAGMYEKAARAMEKKTRELKS